MADNRIAYGLAKKYGIDTSGMSPKEVWDALKKKGINESNISEEAYDSKEKSFGKKPSSNLTKQEWALYYSEIQKAERGEHSSQVMVLNENTRTVFIETSKRATLVIDNNSNKVILSKFFRNYDEMVDYMNTFVKGK